MLNRDLCSGYWDYPLYEIHDDTVMVFVSYFDWDQLNYRDNNYVRVVIKEWLSHPEVIDKHGLIEAQYVRFTTE